MNNELLTSAIKRARFLSSCEEPTFKGQSYLINHLCEELWKIAKAHYESLIAAKRAEWELDFDLHRCIGKDRCPLIAQSVKGAQLAVLAEVEALLSIEPNDYEMLDFSNHVPAKAWQSLRQRIEEGK